ncbi:hypothetical protein QO014_001314 [Kaistia dalseonensis]|uniref:Uncharacterized protein n=1 Tax=Kaistia dalseonensis TaxID=410840 RepID=A0ABU0H3Q1_9HYPH|nr:hypothetical protein [Kaistia dalseonensis]
MSHPVRLSKRHQHPLSVIPAETGTHSSTRRRKLNGSRVKPGMTAVRGAGSVPNRNQV